MSLIGDLFSFISRIRVVLDHVDQLILNGRILAENMVSEVRHIKAFKFDPKWKNRVINVPKAVEQTRDFVHDVCDTVASTFHQLMADLHAIRELHKGIEHDPGGGGSLGIAGLFNQVQQVDDFVQTVNEWIERLNAFVDAMRRVREEFETLDTLFLSQGNLRRVERLEEGGRIRIRIGALHE